MTLAFGLISCARKNEQIPKLTFNDSSYIRIIAEDSFDSLIIRSNYASFFPLVSCIPHQTILNEKGDYYTWFRVNRPELIRIMYNNVICYSYMFPKDTLIVRVTNSADKQSVDVKIDEPVYAYLQKEQIRFGSYYFQSPLAAKYYGSKANSQNELESNMSEIDSEMNSRLLFLEQNLKDLPTWFVEIQRSEYLYMAAHLKYIQNFLFENQNLEGRFPFINVKINNPEALLSSYYYLFLSDYFLLTFSDSSNKLSGPSRMIDLYNKASKSINLNLSGNILSYYNANLLVTLYNACRSQKDIDLVDEFSESYNFNLSQSEQSFISFEKSEATKKLKNTKERSNNVILNNITFHTFPSKSIERDSSAIQDEVYVRPEQNPEFIGGIDAFKEFIKKNLVYPIQCKEAGIQGRVLIMIVVEKDGSISTPRVIKSANTLLDDEALRVAKLLPKFKPGMDKAIPVRVEIVMPIDFKL